MNKLTNREDTIVNNCTFVEMGFSIELEPVAVHGEGACALQGLVHRRQRNEIVALQVLTLDEDGLRTSCLSFDDDLEGATGECDALRGSQ